MKGLFLDTNHCHDLTENTSHLAHGKALHCAIANKSTCTYGEKILHDHLPVQPGSTLAALRSVLQAKYCRILVPDFSKAFDHHL